MPLIRTTAGLLHADDFSADTTGDYTFTGSSTVTVVIEDGYLKMQPPDNHAILALVNGISVGKCFAQIRQRMGATSGDLTAIKLRAVGGSSTLGMTTNDYFLLLNSNGATEIKKRVATCTSTWAAAAPPASASCPSARCSYAPSHSARCGSGRWARSPRRPRCRAGTTT